MSKVMWALATLLLVASAMGDVASHPESISDRELFSAMDLERPGLEAVRDAVENGDYKAAGEAWAAYFRKRQTPTPHFSRETWAGFIRREYPQLVQPIVEKATRVAQGRSRRH